VDGPNDLEPLHHTGTRKSREEGDDERQEGEESNDGMEV
jgi:hypothetical protein